ncbi:MAG: PepSY domain-containing protein [Tissierellia bacterium]|nr:PepSY domain-containing protein [Tissierellia bacterium]
MKTKKILMMVLAVVMMFSVLTACGKNEDTAFVQDVSAAGELIIRVNPEIAIEYNEEGLVTGIKGLNEDGIQIANEYDNYIGRHCKSVVNELIRKVHKNGYFVTDVDGEYRNVTIQIEPGSKIPHDKFLEEIVYDVQTTVKEFDMDSSVLDISDSDYDERYITENAPSRYITKEKAEEIALAHAGVKLENAVFDDRDFDFNNNRPVFEFEFMSNGIEYEYEIDAITGKVIKFEAEYDDTNYGDSPYDGVSRPTERKKELIEKKKEYIEAKKDAVSKPTIKNDSNYGNSPYDEDSDYGDSDYGNIAPVAPTQTNNNSQDSDYDSDYGESNYSDYDDSDYGDSDYK